MTKRLLVVLCFLFYLLPGCAGQKEPEETETFTAREYLLGTEITINIDAGEKAAPVSSRVFERIREIEEKMSVYQPDSEIARLNEGAGISSIPISADTYLVLEKALACSEITGGAFDITVGPLVQLWGINEGNTSVPDTSDVREASALVDYNSLQLVEEGGVYMAYLQQKGQAVDLGGITKGYAGDEAAAILQDSGVESGILNLGGNIVAVGRKKDGNLWRVGVQNPMAPRGTFLGIVEVENKSVVSSGAYERYFIADGKHYHHIIDPRTGYPAESGLLGVTIIAEQGIAADALSTGIFVLGLGKGLQLVEGLPGVEAVFITADQKVYTSRGLKNNFVLTDGEFDYAGY